MKLVLNRHGENVAFDAGQQVLSCDPVYPGEDAADSALWEKYRAGLAQEYARGFRDGEAAAEQEATRKVLKSIVGGHQEQSALVTRLCAFLWKTGIKELSQAASMAKKSTSMIRKAAKGIAF